MEQLKFKDDAIKGRAELEIILDSLVKAYEIKNFYAFTESPEDSSFYAYYHNLSKEEKINWFVESFAEIAKKQKEEALKNNQTPTTTQQENN